MTKNLNKAVKRNFDRFPEEFAFTLTKEEFQNLRFQFGTSSWGGGRYLHKIYLIRGRKVMLDKELAELYGVPTFRLNEQVKRNIKRFPPDFMYQLTKAEFNNLISHFAISNWDGGGNG